MSSPSGAGLSVVLARRSIIHGESVDQRLCLSRGRTRSFRLFTAEGDHLCESSRDIAPVEFDRVSDPRVVEFLIESFWLLNVELSAIRRHLDEKAGKLVSQPVAETSLRSG